MRGEPYESQRATLSPVGDAVATVKLVPSYERGGLGGGAGVIENWNGI
jgi:hypothetical protein